MEAIHLEGSGFMSGITTSPENKTDINDKIECKNSVYTMDSNKIMNNTVISSSQDKLKVLNDSANNTIMTNSSGSTLEDSTPSDSGVQLLDSESSGLNESIMSSSGFDFDNYSSENAQKITRSDGTYNKSVESLELLTISSKCMAKPIPDLLLPATDLVKNIQAISNNSIVENVLINDIQVANATENNQMPDDLISSTCSTFDSENIVYRRRVKKSKNHAQSAPKKRVSFHEDILKNTKTDNIHIEHGFITYKGIKKNGTAGRYSWCSEGDNNDEYNENNRYVYRNACSDVLDYGNADMGSGIENTNYIHYDNSGVFEYGPKYCCDKTQSLNNNEFYKCSCSSSNSSLDSSSSQSEEINDNQNTAKRNYTQAKSNSCDCIGTTANNNINGKLENCYYSEPNIAEEQNKPKSVWSKEKKPKSSCLKKTRRTDIIQECDVSKKVKKFNVHQLPDMNNIIDNSKMIFGSLKNIFSMPLPERGVPEGSEDVQSVYECIPENENNLPSPVRIRPFLSKSLDNGFRENATKKFVHNVDEQLRRKNDEDLFAASNNASRKNSEDLNDDDDDNNEEKILNTSEMITPQIQQNDPNIYRNKFIINCESTVFEHTGVSYCYDSGANCDQIETLDEIVTEKLTPIAEPPSSFSAVPLKQKISNIFKSFTENTSNASTPSSVFSRFSNKDVKTTPTFEDTPSPIIINQKITHNNFIDLNKKNEFNTVNNYDSSLIMNNKIKEKNLMESSFTSSCSDKNSTISDVTSLTSTTLSLTTNENISMNNNNNIISSNKQTASAYSPRKNRHLSSPLHKKSLTTRYERTRMSPDLFNSGRDSKNTLLSEEFDDILTITTTDSDKLNESDIVIVDFNDVNSIGSDKQQQFQAQLSQNGMNNFLKPPATTSKSSLINRFLKNVTQKKILDASIKKNNFFINKVNNEKKIFDKLYVKGVKPRNLELIDDLNAEIAMEIELSSDKNSEYQIKSEINLENNEYNFGVGEVNVDIFDRNNLYILRSVDEILMKVFKLYTGYSREGFMTPVLVFLTDKTLYVTDLVRNRLCNKFVLPYSELDVILIGPYGNTVLLSNGARDMQQVLLAGGPYPADGIVASLEMCARRGGTCLPAVGQLKLDHLASLQNFVRENSSICKNDTWMYYAVVNIPAGTLNCEQEPLGPNIKGPLMHRQISETGVKHAWKPGYFLLKAGVLYMFGDSTQKLPTWAMALAECQGARRAMNTGRPHCFELLIKSGILQLAAPDEYVASEWLQDLVQSASGLFELREKHTSLGCTLIMTSNHIITLREDFAAPLRRVNTNISSPCKENINPNMNSAIRKYSNSNLLDTSSELSSNCSTPMKTSRYSSNGSTPTKCSTDRDVSNCSINYNNSDEKSYSSMSSFYGKNSGIEILTCAAIEEMTALKVSSFSNNWWCILEFSCQEVRENSDDLVIFFATDSELRRFMSILESLWHNNKNTSLPVSVLDQNDQIGEHCSRLFSDLNVSWEPLLSAALGYPQ